LVPNLNNSENLFVANLQSVSLEKLVRSKLEVLFRAKNEKSIDLDGSGLHKLIMEQVEKPLIELTLQSCAGNQVRAACLLGINRNTLKKKIDNYKIRARNKRSLN
jgi:Fis family transcriptional regulator